MYVFIFHGTGYMSKYTSDKWTMYYNRFCIRSWYWHNIILSKYGMFSMYNTEHVWLWLWLITVYDHVYIGHVHIGLYLIKWLPRHTYFMAYSIVSHYEILLLCYSRTKTFCFPFFVCFLLFSFFLTLPFKLITDWYTFFTFHTFINYYA